MSYRYLLTLFLTVLSIRTFSQSPGIEWQRTLPNVEIDGLIGTFVTNDNKLVVHTHVSATRNSAGYDLRLTKLNTDGTIIWDKTYGGSGREFPEQMYQLPDGGFLFIGLTLSRDGDVSGFHGTPSTTPANDDLWVVRLSSTGNIVWQRCLGGSGLEQRTQSLLLPNGSLVILGTTSSTDGDFAGNTGTTPFIAGIDANGQLTYSTLIGDNKTVAGKMLVKPNGNLLVGGYSESPGNRGSSDLFLAEVNPTGNIVSWAEFGGSDTETFSDIVQTGAAQFTVIGNTNSSDFDAAGAHGNGDILMITIDNSGSVLWKKILGGSGKDDFPISYYSTADNSLILAMTSSSSDGDMAGNKGGKDAWIFKMSNSGTITWKQTLGGSNEEIIEKLADKILVDGNGDIYLSGRSLSDDGDMAGLKKGGEDVWMMKFTAAGNLAWQKFYGGSREDMISVFYLMNDELIFLATTTSGDGDVKGEHYNPTGPARMDIWVVNVNKGDGSVKWQNAMGGFHHDVPGELVTIDDKYFLAGTVFSKDGDVSGFSGTFATWLVRFGNANVIKGSVYIDFNGDGIKNADEPLYGEGAKVVSTKAGYQRVNQAYTGAWHSYVDTGTYSTTVTVNSPYFTTDAPKISTFTSYQNVDSFGVALHPVAGKQDLVAELLRLSPARPGFKASYRIYYKNAGSELIPSGKVYMTIDKKTSFVSASPAPSKVVGDTLFWNYSNLKPFNRDTIDVELQVAAPPAVMIGETLTHIVRIEPMQNDLTPDDNADTLKQQVTGSYDPNDKNENHGGSITTDDVAHGEYLTYTIRFQNMGTDTAFNIVVRDTLDAKLDWNSFEMIATSHTGNLTVVDGNKLAWTFSNILLPHSGINEPGSHGFISYRIKPKANLAVGDIINNSASIYFDFNLPIVTNTHQTEVRVPIPAPAKPVLSGLLASYCTSAGTLKAKLINLPPANTTVAVSLGSTVLTVGADSSITVALGTLSAGTKELKVTYTNVTGTETTTASFTVYAALTPDVNMNASATQVSTLPIVINAVNATGGGKNPFYAFAWDRGFTNLIQNDAANSSITIQPAAFNIGDNKVYVRMRTSEACYTSQTAIDSVVIRRDQPTGIVDVDNPGQIINVYPNPFTGPMTLTGLSAAKKYRVSIANLNGQVMYTKRIINRTNAGIAEVPIASGIYWLSIYDEGKKKLLGSIKIIK